MPGIGIWAPEFSLSPFCILCVQELALQFGLLLGDSCRDAQWHKSHLTVAKEIRLSSAFPSGLVIREANKIRIQDI